MSVKEDKGFERLRSGNEGAEAQDTMIRQIGRFNLVWGRIESRIRSWRLIDSLHVGATLAQSGLFRDCAIDKNAHRGIAG